MKKKDDNISLPVLNARQLKFCEQYIILGNACQAAIKAGYSKKTAQEQSSRLLSNVKVKAYIDAKTDKIFDKLDITQERVMREYARLGFSDIRKYYNEDGSLKSITDLDDDAAAALAGVECDELWEFNKDGDKEQVGVTKKIKIWGKREALDSICKVKGWNSPEKIEHSGDITVGYGKEE